MSRRPRHRTISAAVLRRADRRREEARLDAALRDHEAVRQSYERYPFQIGSPGYNELFWGGIALYLLVAATPFVALAFAAKLAASGFRAVRTHAYRARAGVDRSFARECAQRLRDVRDSGRVEYLRVLRALAAERVRREDAREREALALSPQPAAAKRRAAARAKRVLAWQDWFGTLEKAVAGSGTPPREPGMPNLPDRPRRKGAPIRRLCVFSAKPAPTGDEVREQFEKARGRGKVAEKIRLGSMLLDAEATTDSSLIRDNDGEIVGRNGGLRGWIFENCPELLPHYAALTGYRRLAWEARDSEDLFDPVPAELLLASDPEVERKVRPTLRERLPGARKRLRALLAAPESATVAGFLRRLRAERDEREKASRKRRRLA